MTTNYTIRKTRFTNLGFTNLGRGLWRFVDTTEASNVPICIGPHYASKDELLSDAQRYAEQIFGI